MSKVPPPPPIASSDPTFNRWLLQLTSILNNAGDISGGSIDLSTNTQFEELAGTVAGFSQDISNLQTEVTALEHGQTGQGGDISDLQTAVGDLQALTTTQGTDITALQTLTTAQGLAITALQALPVLRNGIVAPATTLGAVGDWYADTVAKHVYVKTAAAVWTLIV